VTFLISTLVAAAVFLAAISRHTVKEKINSLFKKYASWTMLLAEKSIAEVRKNEILRFQLAIFGAIAAVSAALKFYFLIILLLPLVLFSPRWYVQRKKRMYEVKYYREMPAMLEAVISSLKSGMSIVLALKEYSSAADGACAREMQAVIKKTELGMPLKDALASAADAVPLPENLIFTDALITSIETGGSLSEVLSGVLGTIRAREEINREVAALTSQGVMSGIITGAMPVILVAAVSFLDPEFMKPLFETREGNIILAAAVLMEITGAILIKKIIEVK